MVIGSHNSWSYLTPIKWWMRPFAFMARCQRIDIQKQYEMGVRCFDLRLRLGKRSVAYIAHGLVEYNYTLSQLLWDLTWLDQKGDCYVRVMHGTIQQPEDASKHHFYAVVKNRCWRDYAIHKRAHLNPGQRASHVQPLHPSWR